MATAGDIVVNLTANSTQFTKGINQAKSDLSGLSSAVNTAKNLLAGFLTFQGIKGVIGGLRGAIAEVDDLAAASEKLGVTTEFLSEMEYAAKLTDTSVEALHIGLKKMEKTLGEAALGNGDNVVKMLNRAGKDASALAKMGPEQAFLEIADAVSRIPDPMQRAAFATEIFGKGGQELITLLDQGADGIASFREEARKMGLSITKDMADKAGLADDAFKRMDATFQGLKRNLAIELAPALADGAKGLQDMAGFVKPLIGLMGDLGSVLKEVQDDFEEMGVVIGGIWGRAGVKEIEGMLKELAKQRKERAAALANPIRGKGPAGEVLDLGGRTLTDKQQTNPPLDVFSKEGFSVVARAMQSPAINVNQQQLVELKGINKGVGRVEQGLKNIKLPPVGPGFGGGGF